MSRKDRHIETYGNKGNGETEHSFNQFQNLTIVVSEHLPEALVNNDIYSSFASEYWYKMNRFNNGF